MNAPVLQLHGILPAASLRLRSKHPHRMLHFGALSALVSRCPFDGNLDAVDPAGLSDRVMAHHELLLAYSAEHVLLPTRFGAFFSSIDAVRQALGSDEETHLAGLAHLTHRREYNVRLSLPAQPLGGADAPAQQATGAQFLAQRRQARDRRQTVRQDRTDFAKALAQALQDIADVTSFGSREALLDLTMLLTDEERLKLQALLTDQGPRAEQFGLLLEASGPWPAYSFNASLTKRCRSMAVEMHMASPSEALATIDGRLVDLVDGLLDHGVVLRGGLWLTVADVELVFLGLDLVLSSPQKMRELKS